MYNKPAINCGKRSNCTVVGRLAECRTFNDTVVPVQLSIASICCVLEQEISSALLHSTQMNNEYHTGAVS